VLNDAKYIGLDVHQATISVVVLDGTGHLVMESVIETKAATILQLLHGLSGSLHVTFEEGTCAAWLHDLLRPHVAKVETIFPVPCCRRGSICLAFPFCRTGILGMWEGRRAARVHRRRIRFTAIIYRARRPSRVKFRLTSVCDNPILPRVPASQV
jgi:hypothetical protein